jgi:cytochrome c553
MKRIVITVLTVLIVAAAGGLLWASSGLVSVAASSGHWAVTDWFLHYTMRRAVQTQALGIEVPALDDQALIITGAGHYAGGCAACHGAPGEPRSPLAEQMLPQPPELSSAAGEWRPNELFWIVRHGIKYTGMPGWVAPQRDDEIWSVVAFLLQLPELNKQSYRKLAYGDADIPAAAESAADRLRLGDVDARTLEQIVQDCARCHGRHGEGRGFGAFPRLAQFNGDYLFAALQAYADGERASGIMQPLVVGLDKQTLQQLATHFAQLPVDGVAAADINTAPEPAVIARGETIAQQGIPQQGVPACRHCHGPDAVVDNPLFPDIAGQSADYLTKQLELWAAGQRGGSVYAHVMRAVARGLEPDQIRAVAGYFATLPAASADPPR